MDYEQLNRKCFSAFGTFEMKAEKGSQGTSLIGAALRPAELFPVETEAIILSGPRINLQFILSYQKSKLHLLKIESSFIQEGCISQS